MRGENQSLENLISLQKTMYLYCKDTACCVHALYGPPNYLSQHITREARATHAQSEIAKKCQKNQEQSLAKFAKQEHAKPTKKTDLIFQKIGKHSSPRRKEGTGVR